MRIDQLAAIALVPASAFAQATPPTPAVNPESIVDLRTSAGITLVQGQWRYSDATVANAPFRLAGADRKPSGPPDTTYRLEPAAMEPAFDDSSWRTIAPESLEDRRGPGKVSFNWYRLHFTIPKRVGNVDPTGDDVIFEIVVDDYSEISVNGKMPLTLGQTGGGVIPSWNEPNRVVIAHDVVPGQEFTITMLE